MEAATLFNLSFTHWQAILLSLIPALITLAAIIYFRHFPSYKINTVYRLYLFSIFAWQLNDSFSRMSINIQTARSWDRLLCFGWILQFPSCIHFVLLLIGEQKLSNKSWFIFILYFPAFLFAVLLCSGLYAQSFLNLSFWGWTKTFSNFKSFEIVPALWVCSTIIFSILLFGYFAFQHRNSPAKNIFLF